MEKVTGICGKLLNRCYSDLGRERARNAFTGGRCWIVSPKRLHLLIQKGQKLLGIVKLHDAGSACVTGSDGVEVSIGKLSWIVKRSDGNAFNTAIVVQLPSLGSSSA